MTRDEAIAIVDTVMKSEGSEAELDRLIDLLLLSFPCAHISDMIFWEEVDRTSAEIVDEATRRSLAAGGRPS